MENAIPGCALSLDMLRNRHKGERILVCGLGPSLHQLGGLPGRIRIGVNDIFRWCETDYLVVMDPPSSFDRDGPERQAAIIRSRPTKQLIVTEGFEHEWKDRLEIPYVLAPLAPLQPQNHVPSFWDGRFQLHKAAGSPGTAASLAGFMGAKSIGLIGVDLIDHPRIQGGMIEDIDVNGWGRLRTFLKDYGTELVNCSPISALKSLPYVPLDEWAA